MSDALWVESHAPQTLEECILPTYLKNDFRKIDTLPNMLLIGEPGVGKTTVARILCKDIDYMFMNASNERGIDEVRNKIQTFASTTSLFGSHKAIILDESDNLTGDAQKALRHLIEQYQNNCRFILTANYPYKLIPALRSRLTEYVFVYPPHDTELINTFTKRMIQMVASEKVSLREKDVEPIMELARMFYPNWRKCVHELQRCCADGAFDGSAVERLKGMHLSTLFEIMKAKNFPKMREWVAENLAAGVSDERIVVEIYHELDNFLKKQSLPQAVVTLAEYQHKAALVSNPEINTVALCTELMMLEYK